MLVEAAKDEDVLAVDRHTHRQVAGRPRRLGVQVDHTPHVVVNVVHLDRDDSDWFAFGLSVRIAICSACRMVSSGPARAIIKVASWAMRLRAILYLSLYDSKRFVRCLLQACSSHL